MDYYFVSQYNTQEHLLQSTLFVQYASEYRALCFQAYNVASSSLERILSQPLPSEASQAFKDLVYVIETAISLDLTSEREVIPIFQELYELREQLDASPHTQLEKVRSELVDLLEVGS